ncbi:MAG: hypothetical protein ABSF56_03245 [Minisyncoccia bacterium]|jgi:hypothetical protein
MNDLEREKVLRYAELAKVLQAREREGRGSFTKEESEATAGMVVISRELGYTRETILTLARRIKARGMKAGMMSRSSDEAKREPVPGE